MSTSNKIKAYFDYFSDVVDSVKFLTAKAYVKQIRVISLLSILDALSKCRYPSNKRNGDRFKSFIVNYAEWQECKKISIPQLNLYLSQLPASQCSLLKAYVNQKLASWTVGSEISISVDPEINLVESIESVPWINDFKHVDLLWNYRNLLIHEARTPGYGMNLSDDINCYYHSMIYQDRVIRDGWELVYPEAFFVRITENCIRLLRDYCESNNYSPYDSFEFSPLWKTK